VDSRGYKVIVGKPEENRLCGRPVHEWRVILKWIVKKYDLCTYACIYVCMYVRIHVCYVCMFVRVFMYVFTYVRTCVCMYMCAFVCKYVFKYVNTVELGYDDID
jgi:hypothetical protein